MSSFVARTARFFARRFMKTEKSDPEAVVRHFRRLINRTSASAKMPGGVALRAIEPGELGPVRGEWVGVPAATRAILHHHGGAYVAGRPTSNRNLAARIALGLRADVLLAVYRLAPEHPFPAAVDDAIANYRALLERVDPSAIAVSGDSAGGGLTLALLQRIRDEGLPAPAAAVLLSPWADLTDDAPSRSQNHKSDDMLTGIALSGAASAYLAGADPKEAAASPALADLSGLPPLLVAVDESEVLLDDSTRIVEGARAAGGEAVLLKSSGLFHVWPVMVPFLPEAHQTVDEIVTFLDKHLAHA